ncbi:fructosamine kinase family protein [Staphylococcus chromogenes]|uniref:Fructosamine kinase family protein n=1 Tax=Staphylococcus chromogenes TaxID=46126 RepID=A0ABD5AXR9_STACR|nr:fructosamine kinase family protein [Staphylococcus chromogenes]MDQ7176309.1 fructosamine kinase family protein [Staphylococcus chromogenes]
MNEQQWREVLPLEDITTIQPVSGGDVNQAYKIETKDQPYFLLVQPGRSQEFYAAEMAGLQAFEAAGVTAPRVIANGEVSHDAYLLLSYLDEGTSGSQRALGKLVAKLHHTESENGQFGFHLPYEGGDHRFENTWADDWRTLFMQQRLMPLRDMIVERQLLSEEGLALLDKVYDLIDTTLQKHQSRPSLLHGDLWVGNYMFLTDGTPALFDPAPLYGDREFDLGATKVFGGFTQDFYKAYDEAYPLEEGAHLRIHFYELYLLLVHLVKFGAMYEGSVRRMMDTILKEA